MSQRRPAEKLSYRIGLSGSASASTSSQPNSSISRSKKSAETESSHAPGSHITHIEIGNGSRFARNGTIANKQPEQGSVEDVDAGEVAAGRKLLPPLSDIPEDVLSMMDRSTEMSKQEIIRNYPEERARLTRRANASSDSENVTISGTSPPPSSLPGPYDGPLDNFARYPAPSATKDTEKASKTNGSRNGSSSPSHAKASPGHSKKHFKVVESGSTYGANSQRQLAKTTAQPALSASNTGATASRRSASPTVPSRGSHKGSGVHSSAGEESPDASIKTRKRPSPDVPTPNTSLDDDEPTAPASKPAIKKTGSIPPPVDLNDDDILAQLNTESHPSSVTAPRSFASPLAQAGPHPLLHHTSIGNSSSQPRPTNAYRDRTTGGPPRKPMALLAVPGPGSAPPLSTDASDAASNSALPINAFDFPDAETVLVTDDDFTRRPTTRSRKKPLAPTVIELSDDEDDSKDNIKVVSTTSAKVTSKRTAGARGDDDDEEYVPPDSPKNPIIAPTPATMHVPLTDKEEAQDGFRVSYYQDDRGEGHVRADEDAEKHFEHLSYYNELRLTVNTRGISIWTTIQVPKPPAKPRGDSAKKTSTPSTRNRESRKPKPDSAAMDVDPPATQETDSKQAEGESPTKTPPKTKRKPRMMDVDLKLVEIPLSRIETIDAFVLPCLFFIRLKEGDILSKAPGYKDAELKKRELEAEKQLATPPTSISGTSSTAIDLDSPSSPRSPDLSKKRKSPAPEQVRTSPRKAARRDGVTSPLDRSQEVEEQPVIEPPRNRPRVIRTNHAKRQEAIILNDDPKEDLDLSYEVDHEDQAATPKTTATTAGTISTVSRQLVTEVPQNDQVPANNLRLFVVCCFNRDSMIPLLHQLKELSEFVPRPPVVTHIDIESLESSAMDVDAPPAPAPPSAPAQSEEQLRDSKISINSDSEPSSAPKPNTEMPQPEVKLAKPHFKLVGRDATLLKDLPSSFRSKWPAPQQVAAEDKANAALLKAKTPLKLTPSQNPSQTSLPVVLSARHSRNAEEDRKKNVPVDKTYCPPFSIAGWESTCATVAEEYDKVRAKCFDSVWPICIIIPSIRGLACGSIEDNPAIYAMPEELFHESSFPPPRVTRSGKSDSSRPSSFISPNRSSSEPIIIFPKSSTSSSKDGHMEITKEDGIPVGSVCVFQSDINRLQPGIFLNDTLVDFYLKFVQERIMPKSHRRRVRIFGTHFYNLLDENGHKRVAGWTQGHDMFSFDFIIIPINLHLHWKVAVICNASNARESSVKKSKKADADADFEPTPPHSSSSKPSAKASASSKPTNTPPKTTAEDKNTTSAGDDPKQSCILILDSLGGGRDSRIGLNLRKFMAQEAMLMKRPIDTFDISNMPQYSPKVPLQSNFTDCGLFLLHYMELFCKNLPEDLSDGFIRNTLMGEEWFDPADVSRKRRTIQDCIKALVKEDSDTNSNP